MRTDRPVIGDGAELDELRSRAFAIAYRMTGSVADAEDIAQEASLRFERMRRDGAEPDAPRAWVSTVATRLAIDHLRAARVERERYVGPWLPEPLLVDPAPGVDERAELADSLSQAMLVLLESLSPVERAVFLLREVFGYEYAEIAAAVGKREENCRQIAARARRHVDARRPRFAADPRHGQELLERFLAAAERGEVAARRDMLAADAVLYSDGGGKVIAARRPIVGADRVARYLAGITRKRLERGIREQQRVTVNGQPGRITLAPDGGVWDVLAIDVAPDRLIQAVRIVRNPDKLRHLLRVDAPAGTAASR